MNPLLGLAAEAGGLGRKEGEDFLTDSWWAAACWLPLVGTHTHTYGARVGHGEGTGTPTDV